MWWVLPFGVPAGWVVVDRVRSDRPPIRYVGLGPEASCEISERKEEAHDGLSRSDCSSNLQHALGDRRERCRRNPPAGQIPSTATVVAWRTTLVRASEGRCVSGPNSTRLTDADSDAAFVVVGADSTLESGPR